MNNLKNILLAIVFLLTTNSCIEWFTVDDEYYDVTIVNNSTDTIYTHVQGGVDIREPYFEDLWDYSVRCIFPDTSFTYSMRKEAHFYDHRISLIVLKKTTYEKYTIEEIRTQKIMDYGVVYSYEELEKMNFVIKYTGQEKK